MSVVIPSAQNGPGVASVKSASRVLAIFEYFKKVRAARTLSEISQDLGFPVSSTLALLRSVQAMGYLSYDDAQKAYYPSVRFAMLGQWMRDGFFVEGPTLQMMVRLSEATGETVSLGIQNGLQSQHVHIIMPAQSLSYRPEVGTLRPLLRSAVGKALLSQQSRPEIVRTVERINVLGIDEGRKFDAEEVVAELARVRDQRYAYSANVFVQGAAIVAVPMPIVENEPPMAIAVSGPASRIDEEAKVKILASIHRTLAEFTDYVAAAE